MVEAKALGRPERHREEGPGQGSRAGKWRVNGEMRVFNCSCEVIRARELTGRSSGGQAGRTHAQWGLSALPGSNPPQSLGGRQICREAVERLFVAPLSSACPKAVSWVHVRNGVPCWRLETTQVWWAGKRGEERGTRDELALSAGVLEWLAA